MQGQQGMQQPQEGAWPQQQQQQQQVGGVQQQFSQAPLQYVQQGGQQGGQQQQYVVMMPSGGSDPSSTQQLAQAFGGLGMQADKKTQRGVVKRWNLEKGYGFIQPVEGGDDVFVHHSVIHAQGFRSLMEGSDVEYEYFQVAPGRIRATKVTGPGGTYVKGAPRPPNPPMNQGVAGEYRQGSAPGQMQVVQLIQLPNGATIQGVPGQQAGQWAEQPQQQQQQQQQQQGGFVQALPPSAEAQQGQNQAFADSGMFQLQQGLFQQPEQQ